jgi:hypothetical protein
MLEQIRKSVDALDLVARLKRRRAEQRGGFFPIIT